MVRAIERATGEKFNAKKIEGGYKVLKLDGELYKKIKDSTFRRYFKLDDGWDGEDPNPEEQTEPDEYSRFKRKKTVDVAAELSGADRDNMIEKIKKVYKLSLDNPSKEEGMAAILHAQKLMKKYNIHEDELLEEVQDDIAELTQKFKHNAHLFKWYKSLATVVAKNFRVKTYLDENADVVFRGFRDDVEIAKETYHYLYYLGDQLAKHACTDAMDKTGSCRGVYNSYVYGFLQGVEESLDKQCHALKLITPAAVEEDYEKFKQTANLETKSVKTKVSKDKNFLAGLEEGKSAVESKQLTDKKSKKKNKK